MGDPDFTGLRVLDGAGQFVPIGMVRNNERQLNTALADALFDGHPAGGHGENRFIHAAGPWFFQCAGRGDDDLAFEFFLRDARGFTDFAEINAGAFVVISAVPRAAVQVNWRIVAGEAQEADDALGFAEAVGSDEMRAVGEVPYAIEQLGNFFFRVRVLEDRQTKRGFGDEDIALHGLERFDGLIVAAFVVAGDDDAFFVGFEQDLRGAKNMACRVHGDADRTHIERLVVGEFLPTAGGGFAAIADLHDADRVRRSQNLLVAGARMVAVGMGNNGPIHREGRVDIGVQRLYIKVMAKKVHHNDMAAGHPLDQWLASHGWQWFPHQLETLTAASAGRDVLLCAPTGAGKTLSGFLPSFMDMQESPKHTGLRTLYISPLKALSVDVHRSVGKPIDDLHLPIRYETRTGDTPAAKRARQKRDAPDWLMTTPESLALLLSYDNAPEYFKHLRYIIIDELHALIPSKRGDLLSLGLSRLGAIAPKAVRIGLSATVGDPEKAAHWLCRADYAIVQAPARTMPDISILDAGDQRIPWAGHMATYAMKEIYKALTKADMSIVFVNTRAQAELIFQNLWKMNDKDLKIALHHGSLDQTLRRKVEASMAAGQLDCVVATSSLDLGLDWAEVDLVVQVGAPKGVSRLLQRIGRSNHRLNEPSRAILAPTNRFEYLECVAAIAAIKHTEMDALQTRVGGLDVLAQHILGCACSGPVVPGDLFAQVSTAWPYRELSLKDFNDALSLVADGGYVLQAYERFKHLQRTSAGMYEIVNPRAARQYRMNIGTIVEAPLLRVKMGRRKLGTIEEFFINNLAIGDTFLFAGQVVRFEGLHDAEVQVSRTSSASPKIPSYDGGKLPMSTHLSFRVRDLLEHPGNWETLPTMVNEWLTLQAERSQLPDTHSLLVEYFPRAKKHYLVAYPFAGRNANQTLGFLVMRRMARLGDKPLGFVASDYALTVWSLKKPSNIPALFSVDLLGEELHEWLADTPLLKRSFREAAVIAGIIERRHPGLEKSGRQMTFSSDLIYDTLVRHEPDHILLRAARADATGGLIDTDRLSDMLIAMDGKLVVRELEQVSPLAVPMMLEIARESAARKEAGDYHLEDLEESLMLEAGFAISLDEEKAA